MKVLITGGTGFLGRHLVWRFADTGAEVIFTGRNPKAAEEVLRYSKYPVRCELLEHGALGAGSLLERLADGTDIVIHCAALSTPWGRKEDFNHANVNSTAEVLAACHKAHVKRLIHISTPSIYFNFRDNLNIREDAPLPPPVNEYARTKATAETLVFNSPAPQTIILRPRALFGPWDSVLMPRLLRVMRRGTVPLIRAGRALVDLTYIDNAVEAVYLAATRQLPRQLSVYNVSNGEPYELLHVLKMMSGEFGLSLRTRPIPWLAADILARGMEIAAYITSGDEPLLTRYSIGVLTFSQTLDITAIRNELGYNPVVSVKEGIRRHANWWRSYNERITS